MTPPLPAADARPLRVAVVGGGLAGLVAAHRLIELAESSGREIRIQLFEASPRVGGILRSERDGDWLVEHGPDMLQTKPAAVSLIDRLGLSDRAINTDCRYRGAMILKDGRPVPVPKGFALMSPNRPRSLATTPLLTPAGRARAIAEAFVPPGDPGGDPSVAEFARRRFGPEATERIVDPLVAGIYVGDAERLSLGATLPRFFDDEQRDGSLLRAASKRRTRGGPDRPSSVAAPIDDESAGARYGEFVSFPEGIEELVARLAGALDASDRADIAPRSPVTAVRRDDDAFAVIAADRCHHFDAVILAVPAAVAAAVIEAEGVAAAAAAIPHASSAVVVTRHRLAEIADPLAAFGLVIPARENRDVIAISYTSRKFAGRAPDGHVLLRTFVGGVRRPELCDRSDDELIALVAREQADILGAGEPLAAEVVRWPDAMPQYERGHRERVVKLERAVDAVNGLYLCGLSYRGVGIADVIADAEGAAGRLVADVTASAGADRG